GEVYTEEWDRLLLSTGAAPVVPPLPGLQEAGVFTLRNLTDMDAIQAWIEQHNIAHTTLVGGGFIGLEVMEALSERGISVTLLEMGEQVTLPPVHDLGLWETFEQSRVALFTSARTGQPAPRYR
ncbi:FAD-dependent oxidoreductase, partial [Escherichia coli]|nr:FAD-dependent oxidoreductase [Escherichia coli]